MERSEGERPVCNRYSMKFSYVNCFRSHGRARYRAPRVLCYFLYSLVGSGREPRLVAASRRSDRPSSSRTAPGLALSLMVLSWQLISMLEGSKALTRVMKLWDSYKEPHKNGLTMPQFVAVMLQVLPRRRGTEKSAWGGGTASGAAQITGQVPVASSSSAQFGL